MVTDKFRELMDSIEEQLDRDAEGKPEMLAQLSISG